MGSVNAHKGPATEVSVVRIYLEAVFFNPVIGDYAVGEFDRKRLYPLLLNIKREQQEDTHLGIFLRDIPIFPDLGAVGIIQLSHGVAEGAAHPISIAEA